MRHLSFRIFNGQTREERQPTVLGSCSGDVSCRPANLTDFSCLLLLLLLLLLAAIEFSVGAAVLTPVQTKQIRINIHKRNNRNKFCTTRYDQLLLQSALQPLVGFRPAKLSLSILSRKVLQSAVASGTSNPQLGGEPGI
jgi:hypothetical protein